MKKHLLLLGALFVVVAVALATEYTLSSAPDGPYIGNFDYDSGDGAGSGTWIVTTASDTLLIPDDDPSLDPGESSLLEVGAREGDANNNVSVIAGAVDSVVTE